MFVYLEPDEQPLWFPDDDDGYAEYERWLNEQQYWHDRWADEVYG